jgi:cytochrome P450
MPRGAEDWSYDKVASVTYLDDVIMESLRLKPPVITGGYRATPPEGLQIDEVYIPGDIHMFTPFEIMHKDERYWKRSQDFVPERWGERKEEMGTDDSIYLPFSTGTRPLYVFITLRRVGNTKTATGVHKCPGDRLAMMSMRTAISSIVQNFDVRFAPRENGEFFDGGRKDVFTTVMPPLQLSFAPRH